jgi:hypothetical protein
MAAAGIVGFGPQAKFFTNDDCYRKKKIGSHHNGTDAEGFGVIPETLTSTHLLQ